MALNAIFTLSTSNDGSDLTILDESVYDSTTPKSSFTNRHLVFTFADATEVVKEFPYTGTADDVQDTITYSGFFETDSVVDLVVEFEGTSPVFLNVTYLSLINSLKFRSTVANAIDLFNIHNCTEEIAMLNEIDANIESAKYAAEVFQNEKSQKFLDRINELNISYTNGCE